MQIKDSCDRLYQTDPATKNLVDHLPVHTKLNDSINLKFQVAYHTTITRNLLGLHEGRLVYYEVISTSTKHICLIFVPLLLTIIYTTLVICHMGEYRPYKVSAFVYIDHTCVLMS